MTGCALVGGAGEGVGLAAARRFARGGLTAVLASRDAERLARLAAAVDGPTACYAVDLRDPPQVADLVGRVAAEVGPIEAALYNAGAQHRESALTLSPEMFEKVWRLSCFGGFVFAQAVARAMAARGRGTILFSGATASMRGGAGFAAFAAAKMGLRAMAQSFARELGPKGVHVAHLNIDGMIDSAPSRRRFPGRAEELGPDGAIAPDAIAEALWSLHVQPRSAWSLEAEVRPWRESF